MTVAVGVISVGFGLSTSGKSLIAVAVEIGEIGADTVRVVGARTAGVIVGGMPTSVGTGEQANKTARRARAES